MADDGSACRQADNNSRPACRGLRLALSLTPENHGQETAQREIVTAFDNALDARREPITVSFSQVNGVKWLCLSVQALCIAGGDRHDA